MRIAEASRFAIVAMLGLTSTSRAAENLNIALVLSSDETVLAERLQAELTTLGFTVVEIDGAEEPPAALELVAKQANAVAAIRIIRSAGGVELWIADRVTGKTLLRQVVGDRGDSRFSPADIALQAVELLRASLLELGTAHPSHGEVSPSPRLQDIADSSDKARSPAGSAYAFEVGAALLASPGGIPMSSHLQLELAWKSTWRLGARAIASVPIEAARVTGVEGEASVRTTLVGAGLDLHLGPESSRLQSTTGLGLAALWLEMQGVGASSLVGQAGSAVTLSPYARLDASFRLIRRLHLVSEVVVGYALSQPRLRFVGRQVAVFGRPCATLALAFRVDWP